MALYAFVGLGLEALTAFVIEPMIYGTQMREWTTPQNIIHWVITCILWGIVSVLILQSAKHTYGFDILKRGSKVKFWQGGVILVILVACLVESYIKWDGSKVLKEFRYNGWLKFIFQYIYYAFETVLVTLILVFGQVAFEKWFRKPNIPYGGIMLALTWGLAHCFTKNLLTGIWGMIVGFAFGSIYLLTNRDIRKTYPLLFLAFVL